MNDNTWTLSNNEVYALRVAVDKALFNPAGLSEDTLDSLKYIQSWLYRITGGGATYVTVDYDNVQMKDNRVMKMPTVFDLAMRLGDAEKRIEAMASTAIPDLHSIRGRLSHLEQFAQEHEEGESVGEAVNGLHARVGECEENIDTLDDQIDDLNKKSERIQQLQHYQNDHRIRIDQLATRLSETEKLVKEILVATEGDRKLTRDVSANQENRIVATQEWVDRLSKTLAAHVDILKQLGASNTSNIKERLLEANNRISRVEEYIDGLRRFFRNECD